MAKRPRNKKVDRSLFDQGAITPIGALAAALINRSDRKEDRKYQESLEDMGMFEDGGGRANVPVSTNKNFMDSTKNVRKKSVGGKMKSADGIAVKGKTRLSMKGYGKNG
tara:strand:+ start:89 stop:415 length:327 start_codon:yes stop_codon:yes gene_type:complete